MSQLDPLDIQKLLDIINQAQNIVIVQADNPDADSLGSALALELILHEMGKEPYLYCAIDVPAYLRYLPGWDRVASDLPKQFDASVIVDCSTVTLLENSQAKGDLKWLAAKPCVVLDHHETVENPIEFATVTINLPSVSSTGELVYALSREHNLPLPETAFGSIMTAILGDTQGLSNSLTSPQTYRIMADMVEAGADRPALEEKRREAGKMPQEIYAYKARLIERTEFHLDGKLALVTIPQAEINQFSPIYNPAPLIQGDMLGVQDVAVSVVLKSYDDGKILAAIRCNQGAPVGAELAKHFGGGGHDYASGFKLTDGRKLEEVKTELVKQTSELLAKL